MGLHQGKWWFNLVGGAITILKNMNVNGKGLFIILRTWILMKLWTMFVGKCSILYTTYPGVNWQKNVENPWGKPMGKWSTRLPVWWVFLAKTWWLIIVSSYWTWHFVMDWRSVFSNTSNCSWVARSGKKWAIGLQPCKYCNLAGKVIYD